MRVLAVVLAVVVLFSVAVADTPKKIIKRDNLGTIAPGTGQAGQGKLTNLNALKINKSGLLLAKSLGLIKGTIANMGSAGNPVYSTANGLMLSASQPADRKSGTNSMLLLKNVLWDSAARDAVVSGSQEAAIGMQVGPKDDWWTLAGWFNNLPTGAHMYQLTLKMDCGGAAPTIAVGDQLFSGTNVHVDKAKGEIMVVFFYDAAVDTNHGVLVSAGYKGTGGAGTWWFRNIQLKKVN